MRRPRLPRRQSPGRRRRLRLQLGRLRAGVDRLARAAACALQQLEHRYVEDIGKRMVEHGFDYMLLDTAKPLDHALFHYLSTRERLRSVR